MTIRNLRQHAERVAILHHVLAGVCFVLTLAAAFSVEKLLDAALKESKQSKPPITITLDGRTLYRVDSPKVHDADTLTEGVIRLPWGAAIAGRSIRSDYDAWEVTKVRQTVKITDEEIARGKAAADELSKILGQFTLYVSEPERDIDPYDRIDSVWWVRDVSGSVERLADVAKRKGWIRK